jgi:ankyrin repeat protein
MYHVFLYGPYDLENRTFEFAKHVRLFAKKFKPSLSNVMRIKIFMGQTCLCFMGLLALVMVILENPVEAQQLNPSNSSEQALINAARDGQIDMVRSSLEKGARPDAQDTDGRTALMMASYNGHFEMVRLLLEHGAEVGLQDQFGRTALMYAASGPFPETVRLLLDQGANENRQDKEEGFTALMYAAAEGQADVIRVLLAHGADVNMTDKDGDTALDFAKKNGHREAVEILRVRERITSQNSRPDSGQIEPI